MVGESLIARGIVAAALLAILIVFGGCTIQSSPNKAKPRQPCDGDRCPVRQVGWMDLPAAMRESNWGGGSCVHASTVMVLRWQGQEELADWWRATYAGGESDSGLESKCERAGLRWAYTDRGDEAFLDWCSRTHRGATIFYFPNHSICFCGFEGENAVLLDNNHVDDYLRIPRADFVRAWKGYGGFALTVVYSPPPPAPWVRAVLSRSRSGGFNHG